MLDALVTLCAGDPERRPPASSDVPKTQLELVALNASLRTAPTARADAVYAGVLYDALGLGTLSTGARRRATSRVRVTSSLFGLVAPTDRIPAYRLSGDAVLPGLGTVAGVWREALGPEISELVGDGLLVDLRSGMYAAFWRPAGPAAASPPSGCCTRSPAGGRWSATSTRRPRAGSSARCSRTARTRARRPAWPRRCATWAGPSR